MVLGFWLTSKLVLQYTITGTQSNGIVLHSMEKWNQVHNIHTSRDRFDKTLFVFLKVLIFPTQLLTVYHAECCTDVDITTVFSQWYAYILFVAHPLLQGIAHYAIHCNSMGISIRSLAQPAVCLRSDINKCSAYHRKNTVYRLIVSAQVLRAKML